MQNNAGVFMHEQLLHLGHVFKTERESRGVSLKEVENATSIRMTYLEAIESGHLGKLISPIYAQGFIKKYASFLEIDGEQLIQQYPYVVQLLQHHPVTGEEFPLGIGSLEMRNSPGSDVKWLPNLLWVILSVVVILGGWFFARTLGFF